MTPEIETRADLLALIEEDPLLTELAKRVAPRLEDDPGHDLEHALRVARMGLRIAGTRADTREMVAAALLHDVVNLPKDHPERALASQKSATLAHTWLRELGVSEESATRVADAIRTHSYSRGETPTSPLGDALQDADRLEALGAIGVFRTISTGAKMGAVYFDALDPWAEERALDDKRYSIDHFFTKLLSLPATMRTEAGRLEGERRAASMRGVLVQLADELGVPLPEERDAHDTTPTPG